MKRESHNKKGRSLELYVWHCGTRFILGVWNVCGLTMRLYKRYNASSEPEVIVPFFSLIHSKLHHFLRQAD